MRAPDLVTLERGRVRLEPWQPRHDLDMLEAAQDDEVWRWMPIPRPRAVSDLVAARQNHIGQPWAVLVDGRAAGSTSYLDVLPAVGALEIGWTWYRRDLWSTEVNPTCKLLLLSYAFDDLDAERVTLKTDALNLRSQAAITKLGCQYDGTLRHAHRRPDGTIRDTAYFSMLAREWPVAKQQLEHRLR